MELLKETSPNGTPVVVKPITNAEREAVRAQRGKGGRHLAPSAAVKTGTFLEVATLKNLNKLWPWVREGIERIKTKDSHSGTWTAQHVRARVEAGLQGLAPVQMWFVKGTDKPLLNDLGEVGNHPIGFFVATGYPDPYLACPYILWIWLAAGKVFESRRHLKAVVHEIKQYGRNAGFAKIQWGTGRQWGPLASQLGFKAIQVIWEMDL